MAQIASPGENAAVKRLERDPQEKSEEKFV